MNNKNLSLQLSRSLNIQFVNAPTKIWDSSRVLPISADRDHIKTLFENGMLKIPMPRQKAS